MRVIAGSARRLQLKTLPGSDTRPTTDRIKETLFNVLNFDLPGSAFLDLFAGSGAIGIEALSRGAVSAVFVDKNPKAAAIIRENLEHTHLSGAAEVISGDAAFALKKMEAQGRGFDIVFMDPPYNCQLEDAALRYFADSKLINSDSRLIVEMSLESDTVHFSQMGFDIDKIKFYKTNKHVFLRRSF